VNPAPTLTVWLHLLAVLAIEVALVVGVAGLMSPLTKSVAWRRTTWQVCILSLLALATLELTGAGRAAANWLGRRIHPAYGGVAPAFPAISSGRLTDEFRREVAEQVALNKQREAVEPAGTNSLGTRPRTTLSLSSGPSKRDPTALGPADEYSVPDSVGVLRLGLIWLIGSLLVLGRGCLARFLFALFRRRRRIIADAALQKRVAVLAQCLGIRRRIHLIEAEGLISPVVFGVLRPTLGLPGGFTGRFTVSQQDAMLAHELAHLAAQDPFWYLLADLAVAILWWHPLAWRARALLRDASETAADEASLLVTNGPGALAECLMALGAQLSQQRSLGWMGVHGFRSGLGRRVERLIHLNGRVWCPPGRVRSALAKTFGPGALALSVILGTAWVGPQAFTKGATMKTMKQTWKQSLAAFALLATIQTETAAVPARDGGVVRDTTRSSAPVPDGKLLYEMGKLDEAEARFKEAARANPNDETAFHYLTLIAENRYAQNARGRAAVQTPDTPAVETQVDRREASPSALPYERLMLERYGLIPKGAPLPAASAPSRKERERSPIATKLERIVLDEVKFDGVPLPQVLQFLDEESRKRDPDKQGINFLINPNTTQISSPPAIDPATGQPIPLPPPEPMDMNSVIVRFNLPLRNVRLKDLLDAMVKVADKPIEYSIEEYGVVFSQNPNLPGGSAPKPWAAAQGTEPQLQVRSFKVDTNTFLTGLKRAFGVGVEPKENATADQIRSALREVFSKLGIQMDVPGKTVFYNDLTGIVMARATFEDLEIIKAAIETLGGIPNDQASQGGAAAVHEGVPSTYGELMRRRYGLGPAHQ